MVMRGKAVQTELGWEPAYWIPAIGEWCIEPGFTCKTRSDCQAMIARDAKACQRIEGKQRQYANGYAYACGER